MTAVDELEQLMSHVFTEEGGPLPEVLYLTSITRERVAAMNANTQAMALGAWQSAGFPAARDAAGASVWLKGDELRAISRLLASFEHSVSDLHVIHAVTGRLDELSDGERYTVGSIARGHGIENVSGLIFTEGELFVLTRIIDRVVALRDAQPAPAAVDVDPLPEPGRTVAEPVDEPADLELVPPDGKVADVVAWVDSDPKRARAALDAERKGKARKSLLSKLELLAAPAGDTPAPTGSGLEAALEQRVEAEGDPFDGINGEAPSSSSSDTVDAEPTPMSPGVKVPDVPAPSVTLAGGRLRPDEALERLDAVLEQLTSTAAELQQLADRIRAEN